MIELSVIQQPPDPKLIERLEALLAEAKTGELQTIVYVGSWRGSDISSGWAGLRNNRMRFMGELYQILHDLAEQDKRS
jgi:hypothetical protein